MRLQPQEIASIKTAFKNNFRGGKIYLFGSRTDDKQRGGDIDLYLHLNENTEEVHQQKIDVIIAKDKNRLIEQEALKNRIEL